MRDLALDRLRGIAVIWIHFVDVFYLLWDRAYGFDFFGGYIFSGIPLYFLPPPFSAFLSGDRIPVYFLSPPLFAFCSGVALIIWTEKHKGDYRYLFNRIGLLWLSGLLIDYYVCLGAFESIGIFVMIAFMNLILYFFNSIPASIIGVGIVLFLNHSIPLGYRWLSPILPYFNGQNMPLIPNYIPNLIWQGNFPLIPFLAWGFWSAFVGRIKNRDRNLILSGIIPISIAFILRTWEPFVYSGGGTQLNTTSMIFLTFGLFSLMLYALRFVKIPYLNIYGQYWWRMFFWRYFFLYMPFVWLGKFRAFNNEMAFVLSMIMALAQILLVALPKILSGEIFTASEKEIESANNI